MKLPDKITVWCCLCCGRWQRFRGPCDSLCGEQTVAVDFYRLDDPG